MKRLDIRQYVCRVIGKRDPEFDGTPEEIAERIVKRIIENLHQAKRDAKSGEIKA